MSNYSSTSQTLLIAACNLVRFYEAVVRDATSTNVHWGTIVNNFQHQWKAPKKRNKEGVAETPKTSKTLTIIK